MPAEPSASEPSPSRRERPVRVPLLLAAAAAVLYFSAAAARDFWAPDEPDFAEQTREMLERGSLLLPYQNGKPYSEKPILFYWAMAATTPLSGGDVHPAATRLPSVFAGAFLVFAAAWLAGRRGGAREALAAGAMTAVAPLVFWQGQFLQIDAFFSALLLAALLAQLLVEDDPARAGRWVWAFHLLLPLAVLTKGPLALVLTGLVAAVRAALERSWRPITGLRPVRGAVVFVLLVVPWYVLATRSGGPEYAYDLVVKQNWVRFREAFDHIQPWWFYLRSIWGDFMPWTPLALAAPFVLKRRGVLERRPELRFATVACATIFVFLSISDSKQGKYILVLYPLGAVLATALLAELERRAAGGLAAARAYLALLSAALLGATFLLEPLVSSRFPDYAFVVPYVAVPLAVGAAGTLWVVLARKREAVAAALALAATLGAAEAALGVAVFPAVDLAKTGRPFYDRIRPLVSSGEPLAYFGDPYRSYAILQLRRRTEHFVSEAKLVSWLDATPGAFVLVDASEAVKWRPETWARVETRDRQGVGQDEVLLLARR